MGNGALIAPHVDWCENVNCSGLDAASFCEGGCMQVMSKHYPVEQRERALKMVLDHLAEYRSVYAPPAR